MNVFIENTVHLHSGDCPYTLYWFPCIWNRVQCNNNNPCLAIIPPHELSKNIKNITPSVENCLSSNGKDLSTVAGRKAAETHSPLLVSWPGWISLSERSSPLRKSELMGSPSQICTYTQGEREREGEGERERERERENMCPPTSHSPMCLQTCQLSRFSRVSLVFSPPLPPCSHFVISL